ncbi:S9 family peptidase [Asaia prunellae]|uniref:S9 family peptidase n=1 Tax=Asaia prunellae TaxID=610245 RepID=UPI000472B6C4|nr:S9 family peptidase [Asaia prunellae]
MSLKTLSPAFLLCASLLTPPLLAPALGATATPLHLFSAPALSPDGRTLATLDTLEQADSDETPVPSLVLRSLPDGKTMTIPMPCSDCIPSSPSWSPDGSHLAFIVRQKNTQNRQILRVGREGKNPETLLKFTGSLQDLRYGPRGGLAVLAIANARRDPGALQAGAPETGEIDAKEDEQRIAMVEKNGLHWQSPDGLYVYEYDWQSGPAPAFIGTAAKGNGDAHWWQAHLSRFADGQEKILYTHGLSQQIGLPLVAPDGKTVSFVAGLMSDFGFFGGDALQLDLTRPDATPIILTKNSKATVTGLSWCQGRLIASSVASPKTTIQALDDKAPLMVNSDDLLSDGGGEPRIICAGDQSIVIRQNFTKAPEVWAGRIGDWQQVTHLNQGLSAPVKAESISWTSDGFSVQGWHLAPLSRPASMTRNGKVPMITEIHGGPSSAVTPRFLRANSDAAVLLKAGYDLFMPNPRGSYGQGEAFTMANRRDFGHGDLRDVQRGIDALEKTAAIDENRLGITGYSYGGYMTMWIVTQTNRFKAAAAGGGIANWQSYYGQNGIDAWMPPFFGATVYDDPAIYAHSSPITFIKQVRTPTFIYVGANDVECPPAQSLEFYHALRALGIPTSLVIYPGEGHGMRGRDHAIDAQKRMLVWFDRYLNARGASPEPAN